MRRWTGRNTSWNQVSRRNINNLRYADDTTLMAESEEELKSLLMKVKEERKSWHKAQHSENEDHGIWSHHFMENRWGNSRNSSVQFSSVQLLSRVRLFATPRIAARQASLFITVSWSSLRLTSIESVMPSSHLILGGPLLLLPPISPSIRVFFQ